MTQYSGSCPLEALSLTTNSSDRLVGSFTLDGSGGAGPTIQVTFDAQLIKEFSK